MVAEPGLNPRFLDRGSSDICRKREGEGGVLEKRDAVIKKCDPERIGAWTIMTAPTAAGALSLQPQVATLGVAGVLEKCIWHDRPFLEDPRSIGKLSILTEWQKTLDRWEEQVLQCLAVKRVDV